MAAQVVADHDSLRGTVLAAVRNLDGEAVRDVLARTLRSQGVDFTVAHVLLPVLRQVGDDWATGELSVLHEHFASNTIRGVVGYVGGRSPGPSDRIVVLACPPLELHDLALELFGALLRPRGWHVVNLGADTPLAAVGEAVRLLKADACVL